MRLKAKRLKHTAGKLHWYFFIGLYRSSRLLTGKYELKRYARMKDLLLTRGSSGYRVSINDAGIGMDNEHLLPGGHYSGNTTYIGEIDQDGFIYPYFDLQGDLPLTSREQFFERVKHKLFLVVHNGYLGVEKRYSNRLKFLNEFTALIHLNEAGCSVPAVLDVDFNEMTFIISYIQGKVLQEELARRGAVLRDAQLGNLKDFTGEDKEAMVDRRINEALRVINRTADTDYIKLVYEQIMKIHRAGIYIGDVKYGNLITEKMSGKPYLIDFEGSILMSRIKSRRSREILIQRDISKFRKMFGLTDQDFKAMMMPSMEEALIDGKEG